MQDDLQEQVSELLRQVCGTSAFDGIYRLVCLLEHEGPQSGVRLLAVPRAAVRRSKPRGDGRHAVRRAEVLHRVEGRDQPVVVRQCGVG